MGVPAFFRWMSQKYPRALVYVKEDTPREGIPVDTSQPNPNGVEFDNLYLDMNGIIHPASHPEDGPAPETEHDMFLAVMEYLDRVFACVRPRRVLYMAIDGVAPRAKMNQQRARRFRSAQEMEERIASEQELRRSLIADGVDVPPEPDKTPFDSNVITPGTPFMYNLAIYLRWFIRHKIENDPGWRNIKVIFSDASVPGEGEHKIMEYIRLQRASPGYDPNTSHVIHGLDADLIMLALATHDPHFCILREEVTFGEAKPKDTLPGMEPKVEDPLPAAKPFQFVKIHVLREYLEKEFRDADYSCAGGFDLERVIDDFVLMCFFVGNDFLPHLPSLEIREGAIDTILDIYKLIFNEFGGYLTHNCELNLQGVQVMMKELGSLEDEVLRDRRKKEKRFEERRNQKAINIQNKRSSKQHLELIHKLTSNTAGHAVALGTGQAPAFNATGEGGGTKRQRLNVSSDAAATSTHASVDAFRIKNRGVGGVRVLQPGAYERDAQKLHIMDKVREFADKTGATVQRKLELKNLNGMQRAVAHEYCEELGLDHDSKGAEPNRFILVTRPDDVVPDDQLSAEEKKEKFDGLLKKKIHEHDDAIADKQTDTVDLGREGWKGRYYQEKLDGVNPSDIAREYIGGLIWVFKYYYMGCQSWNWFFPYHYSPFASDLSQLLSTGYTNPTFELGTPFQPYEQLMSVFPSASGGVLPPAFQALMREDSVIGDFYPLEFQLDLNGKRRLWQAVVLLPFIDEQRLLEAVRPLEDELDGEEKIRNERGHTYLFAHRTNAIANLLASAPPLIMTMPTAPSVTKMQELRAAQARADADGNKEMEAEFIKELEQVRAEAAAYLAAMKLKDGLAIDPSAECGNGMLGSVAVHPNEPKLEAPVPAPAFEGVRVTSSYRPYDIASNNVVSVVHKNPNSGLHKTTLLPGLTMPPPELTNFDGPVIDQSRIRRPIRFRGGQQVFYQEHSNRGPRNMGPSNRMIRQNMSMGGRPTHGAGYGPGPGQGPGNWGAQPRGGGYPPHRPPPGRGGGGFGGPPGGGYGGRGYQQPRRGGVGRGSGGRGGGYSRGY